MNKTEKAKIWKEHFDKLLNTEDKKELIKTENKESGEVDVEEITIEDVEKAVIKLKKQQGIGNGWNTIRINKIWRI